MQMGIAEKLDRLSESSLIRLEATVIGLTFLGLMLVTQKIPVGDMLLYQNVGESILKGLIPYRDFTLEYPPYCIPLFILPAALTTEITNYQFLFCLQLGILDILLKLFFLKAIGSAAPPSRQLACLGLYCLSSLSLAYLYLRRFDLVVAMTVPLAILSFRKSKWTGCGFWIGIGTLIKLYPLLFIPPAMFQAHKENRLYPLIRGGLLSIIPALLLLPWAPWWKFILFHTERGLQVESLYASLLWAFRFLGIDVVWTFNHSWWEIQGSVADALIPLARILFIGTVLLSTFAAIKLVRASSPPHRESNFLIAMLLPLMAFVTWNLVLSPQYHIWLSTLSALVFATTTTASLKRDMAILTLISICVPLYYPSRSYHYGLDAPKTCVLLIRNIGLVVIWLNLLKHAFRGGDTTLPKLKEDDFLDPLPPTLAEPKSHRHRVNPKTSQYALLMVPILIG